MAALDILALIKFDKATQNTEVGFALNWENKYNLEAHFKGNHLTQHHYFALTWAELCNNKYFFYLGIHDWTQFSPIYPVSHGYITHSHYAENTHNFPASAAGRGKRINTANNKPVTNKTSSCRVTDKTRQD